MERGFIEAKINLGPDQAPHFHEGELGEVLNDIREKCPTLAEILENLSDKEVVLLEWAFNYESVGFRDLRRIEEGDPLIDELNKWHAITDKELKKKDARQLARYIYDPRLLKTQSFKDE